MEIKEVNANEFEITKIKRLEFINLAEKLYWSCIRKKQRWEKLQFYSLVSYWMQESASFRMLMQCYPFLHQTGLKISIDSMLEDLGFNKMIIEEEKCQRLEGKGNVEDVKIQKGC